MTREEREDRRELRKYWNNNNSYMLTDCNCGSYALDIKFDWYYPYPYIDIAEVIHSLIEEGYTKEEIYDRLLSEQIDYMLNDFDDLRVLENIGDIKRGERLIAYRIGYMVKDEIDEDGDDSSYIHFDFHYRFYEHGRWKEKCGSQELRDCTAEMIRNEWNGSDGLVYDSRVVYFALKI